ncbi:hypothetical protein ABT150_51430 [Streptomyces mirabilis]
MAVVVTVAQTVWDRVFGAAMDVIEDCFARPETRATAAEMISGLPREVDTRNCWTLAQALGHPGPHRLQHLLSRARFDHDRARGEVARLVGPVGPLPQTLLVGPVVCPGIAGSEHQLTGSTLGTGVEVPHPEQPLVQQLGAQAEGTIVVAGYPYEMYIRVVGHAGHHAASPSGRRNRLTATRSLRDNP